MKCLKCQKLITHMNLIGCCKTKGTVSLNGCNDDFEPMVISYPIHDFGKIDIGDQLMKIEEEFKEVVSAYVHEGTDRIIEECCDLIQATFNAIEIIECGRSGKITGGVSEALRLHSQKMIDRGYPVKYFIEMKEVNQ